MKIKVSLFAIILAAFAFTACNEGGTKVDVEPTTLTPENQAMVDSLSYLVGSQIGSFFGELGGNVNLDNFLKGYADAANEVPDSTLMISMTDMATVNRIFNGFQQMRVDMMTEKNSKIAEEFLAENGTKEGVVTTASGLQYLVLNEGTSDVTPTAEDTVTVHYHGTLIDGTVFDSSVERNEPATFPLSGVIPGWTEGVQLMKVGAKYRFFIPPALAYGEQGRFNPQTREYGIEPNELLIFEIELIAVNPPSETPEVAKSK